MVYLRMQRLESECRGGGSGRNQPEGRAWAKAQRRRCKGQCVLLFVLESQVLFGGPAVFPFIFFIWRIIAVHRCVGFCHISMWISHTSCVHAMLIQSCPTLCDPMDGSPPGSSVHGILQARILEWVAISFSKGSSQPRDWICLSLSSPALVGRFFTTSAPWEGLFRHCCLCCAESLSPVWLFSTLWTIAYKAPLSMGILQARILEWVAMPSSRGSSQPRNRTQVSHIGGECFTISATREALI